jgi:hypothetical protein
MRFIKRHLTKEVTFFSSTIELLYQYEIYLVKSKKHKYDSDLLNEVLKIIDQLDYSLERVMLLSVQYPKLLQKYIESLKLPKDYVPNFENDQKRISQMEFLEYQEQDTIFMLQFYTESFYYFAYRIRLISRNKSVPLPGLEILELKSIAEIRDQLLFHPEDKKSQAFQQSFSWSKETGPKLKPNSTNTSNVQIKDKGLFVNVKELKDEIESKLKIFLDSNKDNNNSKS